MSKKKSTISNYSNWNWKTYNLFNLHYVPHHKQKKQSLPETSQTLKDLFTTVYECLKIYLYKLNGFAVRTILYKFSARNTNMFALFGLSCTRFAITICPALLKSLSWSTACWNGQISSGILRQERKIILMEFPPLEWVVISINCRKLQVSGNFACRAISW